MRSIIFKRATVFLWLACYLGSMTAIPLMAEETAKIRTVLKATRYIDVGEVASVLDLLDIEYAVKGDQNIIVVRGRNQDVETALKVIEALDEARPSFEVRLFVLAASKDDKTPADLSPELEKAVGQIRDLFGYQSFELLDSVFLQVMEGRKGQIDGGIQLGDTAERTPYRLRFNKVHLVPEDHRTRVRIDGLSFDLSGAGADSHRAELQTDVEILEGQKAVIGSSTPGGIGETLVLIVEVGMIGESPGKLGSDSPR